MYMLTNQVTRRHGCNTHDSSSNKPSDLHFTYPATTEIHMKIRKHSNYCTYNPPCTFIFFPFISLLICNYSPFDNLIEAPTIFRTKRDLSMYVHSYVLTYISEYTCSFAKKLTMKIHSTVGPRLSESPLSEPSVIRTLFGITKSLKTTWFSVKTSNKPCLCDF